MNSSIKNNHILLILIILIVLIAAAGWIIPSITGDHLDNHEAGTWAGPWHMMGMGAFWMFPLFPIIVLAVILYFILGRDQGRWSGPNFGDSALEILKKRYAKGEITIKEFEEVKKDLIN